LERYPRVFPNLYIQLVRAGEASGKLEVFLDRLTGYLEREEEIRKKISKAMAYPIFMLVFAVGIVAAVLTFVIPGMADMFSRSGGELPGPTRMMMNLSEFFRAYWPVGLVLFIVSYVALRSWRTTASGKYKFDEILLKIPMISYFSKIKAVVQFSKTLGMLLEGGVNLSESLGIVCSIVDNNVLKQKLNEARDNIIKEGKIAKYLRDTGIFPNMASYMIGTGEQSGQLAQMLLTVGGDYETELGEATDSIVGKITPIMTLVLALIVLFIILAVFMPIMEMGNLGGM
jgi:type II secretory pathway component PulF